MLDTGPNHTQLRPPGFAGVLAFVAISALLGCHPDRVTIRVHQPTGRETVPLDLVWEARLESCCKYGLYVPEEAKATCSPSNRCEAAISREGDDPHHPDIMRLQVVGLGAGPVDVELRYRQPHSDEWRAEEVHLEFVPAPQLRTLELGMGLPKGPFLFEHISSELAARQVRAPARCERQDDFDESYACFSPVEVKGERRYPSSVHSSHFRETLQEGRFRISLHRYRETGQIYRIQMSAETDSRVEQFGAWE